MSAETFSKRLPQNTPGKFYVDDQCLDCDLCRETAPNLFKRIDTEGTSYLFKQPETTEERELAEEALEGCCTQAIHNDGDQFDWSAPRKLQPNSQRARKSKPSCSHCQKPNKPWWKFWGGQG